MNDEFFVRGYYGTP